MALIKVNRFKEALTDCDAALLLDTAYVKALLRRASVHAKLMNLTSAFLGVESVTHLFLFFILMFYFISRFYCQSECNSLDYARVLELEPNNSQAKKEMDLLKKGKLDMTAVDKALKEQKLHQAKPDQAKPSTSPTATTKASEQKVTPTNAPKSNVSTPTHNVANAKSPHISKQETAPQQPKSSPMNKPNEANPQLQKDSLLDFAEKKSMARFCSYLFIYFFVSAFVGNYLFSLCFIDT
jgi:hypothetical protein